eukprot:4659092-Heterocapsa_arctica.AAC.1
MLAKQWRKSCKTGEAAADDSASENAVRHTFAILGQSGNGKRVTVRATLEMAFRKKGCNVLVVVSTGLQAAEYRSTYPQLDVDMTHSAFAIHKPLCDIFEEMLLYDLVVVDEVGQVNKAILDHLIVCWAAAEQPPTLVFVGDFMQITSVDNWRLVGYPTRNHFMAQFNNE